MVFHTRPHGCRSLQDSEVHSERPVTMPIRRVASGVLSTVSITVVEWSEPYMEPQPRIVVVKSRTGNQSTLAESRGKTAAACTGTRTRSTCRRHTWAPSFYSVRYVDAAPRAHYSSRSTCQTRPHLLDPSARRKADSRISRRRCRRRTRRRRRCRWQMLTTVIGGQQQSTNCTPRAAS